MADQDLTFTAGAMEFGCLAPALVPCPSNKPWWITNMASSRRVEAPTLSKILVR